MELVRKQDMATRVKFSDNIPQQEFDIHLQAVEENDVHPYIGTACLNAILALDRESATDQAKEIYAFWRDYVLIYAIYSVYSYFIDTHGINFGPHGIMALPTGGPQQMAGVSANDRSALKKTYERLKANSLNRLIKRFEDVDKTFDGTSYALDDNVTGNRPKVAGISAFGNVLREMPYKRKLRL